MSDRFTPSNSGPASSVGMTDGSSSSGRGEGGADPRQDGGARPAGAHPAGEGLSQGLDAYLQAQSVMAESVQTIWREWVTYSQESMQRTGQQMERLAKARTLQDMATIQSDILRDEMDRLLRSGMRISELASRAARDAAQKIKDQQGERPPEGTRPAGTSGGGI